jgi:hypothetical protein
VGEKKKKTIRTRPTNLVGWMIGMTPVADAIGATSSLAERVVTSSVLI